METPVGPRRALYGPFDPLCRLHRGWAHGRPTGTLVTRCTYPSWASSLFQGTETVVPVARLQGLFPETSAMDEPTGSGRHIPAGRRRALPVFRCAMLYLELYIPGPCSTGSVQGGWQPCLAFHQYQNQE